MAALNIYNNISVFLLHGLAYIFLCPSKFKPSKTILIWGTTAVALSVGCWSILRIDATVIGAMSCLVFTIGACCVCCIYVSIYKPEKTIFLFTTYSLTFMILAFLAGVISAFIFDDNLIIFIIIRTMLHILLIVFCATKLKNIFPTMSESIDRGWLPLNLATVFLLVMIVIIVIATHENGYNVTDITFFILVTGTTIAVFFIFFNTINHMKKSAEAEKIELQSIFLTKQINAMEESIEAAKRTNHDTRHHNAIIGEYAKSNDIQGLLHYLHDCEMENQIDNSSRFCENSIANNIITAYYKKAQQHGIIITVEAHLNNETKLRTNDIVAILANALENAINGCLGSGEQNQMIDLQMYTKKRKLVIKIDNTSKANIQFKNEIPINKNSNGIGISSIKKSISNYKGEIDFSQHDKMFSCKILLNL